MKLSKYLRTGIGAATLASIWSAFDALVHVAIDMVEPLRIAGNVAVWVACAVSIVALRVAGGPKLAGFVCGLGAVVVLGFNFAWVAEEGALPVPAAVFFGLAVLLLLLAGRLFFGEAAVARSQPEA